MSYCDPRSFDQRRGQSGAHPTPASAFDSRLDDGTVGRTHCTAEGLRVSAGRRGLHERLDGDGAGYLARLVSSQAVSNGEEWGAE